MYLCKNLRVKEGRGLVFEGGLFSGGYGTCRWHVKYLPLDIGHK